MITYLHVYAINAGSNRGILKLGNSSFPCLLGKNGRTFRKREGDGMSPVGKWRLQLLFYHGDKMKRPRNDLKTRQLRKNDGWCDERGHGQYNRLVKLPFKASHENLMRSDQAYNIVISTNHNQLPRKQNAGSAIFLHVINSGATGTEGCIALSEKHLRMILLRCRAKTYLVI
jgi:L,D-peptidoglycan transpeptidase YkuD (ErfK/YbiS/YcfS/YnhG family)